MSSLAALGRVDSVRSELSSAPSSSARARVPSVSPSPELLFRPPPRRPPPLEGPPDGCLPEALLDGEAPSSVDAAVAPAISSKRPSCERNRGGRGVSGVGSLEKRQSNDSLTAKTKKKVATSKHRQADLKYDQAAEDEILESLRRENHEEHHEEDAGSGSIISAAEFERQLGHHGPDAAGKLVRRDQWPCPECTFWNSNLLQYCEMCETPRQESMQLTNPSAHFPAMLSHSQAWAMQAGEEEGSEDNEYEDDFEAEDAEGAPADAEQTQHGSQTRQLIEELTLCRPKAVEAFRNALADGEQPLRSVKLCFVGHARAGKTSTLRALAGRPFDAEEPSTHGVATASLANELLEARAPEEVADEVPWESLENGLKSVGELLEQSVARKVAENMRLLEDGGGEGLSGGSPPARSSTSPPTNSSPGQCARAASSLKMPIDLIASAVREGSGATTQAVVMQTWDFAGDDLYYNMAHVFITALGVYCLVLDLSAWDDPGAAAEAGAPTSALAAEPEPTASLDFWLSAIFVHAPGAKLVIVGSHVDAIAQRNRESVYARVNEYLQRRLDKMPSLFERLCGNELEQLLFFPIDNSRQSSDGQRSVDNLRATLNKLALELVDTLRPIPTRWAHFFHELSVGGGGSDAAVPYRTLEECRRLAEPFGLTDENQEMEPCLSLFHGLGQLLYFRGSSTVVLDPQWLLDAMAQVVACPRVLASQPPPRTAALRGRGELSPALLSHLWRDERFRGHEATLQAFLEHFDLLVPSPRQGSEEVWLVPSMLPQCCEGGPPRLEAAAVLLLDFHGALRKLLVTLLPRLLCQLRRREGKRQLHVYTVFRDLVKFRFGNPPLNIMLELLPSAAPEVVRVSVAAARSSQTVEVESLQAVIETLREALQAWLPHVSFAVKLPCPCCAARAYGSGDAAAFSGQNPDPHENSLDFLEVLNEEDLNCAVHGPVDEGDLPACFRRFRARLRGRHSPAAAEPKTLAAQAAVAMPPPLPRCRPPGGGEAAGGGASTDEPLVAALFQADPAAPTFRLRYLYASPLSCPQLDVASELGALQRIPTAAVEVRVATVDALCEALVGQAEHDVLHLTAHCGVRPEPIVLLEDEASIVRGLTAETLAGLGPWRRVRLLVFLGCGSELVVRRLFARCGCFPAVCCTNPVFDSAARNFEKAFYHFLGAGFPIQDCHVWAQNSVRCAGGGMQREADKFVLLGCEGMAGGLVSGAPGPVRSRPKASWPLHQRVEQYICRTEVALQIATAFLQERHVVLLHGSSGMGKTSVCREFCHHFSAPGGRLFSACALLLEGREIEALLRDPTPGTFRDRFARVVLQELGVRGPASVRGRMAEGDSAPWDDLMGAARQLDDLGRWLLVVDGLRELEPNGDAGGGPVQEEPLVSALSNLLLSSRSLHLLLASRELLQGRWKRLADKKTVSVMLEPLPQHDAARLFVRNVHRGLYLHDFSPGAEAPSSKERPSQHLLLEEALHHVSGCELLRLLGGVPGRLVEAADKVDNTLPSLTRHPLLAAPPYPD